MPRHTFLDSILNRPSQSYAPGQGPSGSGRGRTWSSPADLPNAPGSGAQPSLLGGSLFKKKSKAGLSNMGSEAGASTSTTGVRSRFGRKKRDSYGASYDNGRYASSNAAGSMHYAPSSVADSQATQSKRKSRWWETGSLGFGRRSRAPSIAGDSIFSEPEPAAGQAAWNAHGLAGIGAGTKPKRSAHSDYGGGSPRFRPGHGDVPPLPQPSPTALRYGMSSPTPSGSGPPGRLQSNVAPLGASTLNPSLSKKASKPSVALSPQSSIRKASSASPLPIRATSPPPLPSHPAPRLPGSLATSPHVRRLSQDGHSKDGDGTDWKDFVKSLSGSEISKAWEGTRDAPNMTTAAAKGRQSVNLERRRSHYERVQKELQQDVQFEQTVRDPGVVHQDLLARAASQVVGSPPAGAELEGEDYVGGLQPGAIVRPAADVRRSIEVPHSPPPGSDNEANQETIHRDLGVQQTENARKEIEEAQDAPSDSEGDDDGDEERSDSTDSSEEDSVVRKQTMLEVVREEDEDGNSSIGNGSFSKRQAPSFDQGQHDEQTSEEPRYKAFAAALNKTRYSTSSASGAAVPFNATSSRNPSVRTSSLAGSKASHVSSSAASQNDRSVAEQTAQAEQDSFGLQVPHVQVSAEDSVDSISTPKGKQSHNSLRGLASGSDAGKSAEDGLEEHFTDAHSPSSEVPPSPVAKSKQNRLLPLDDDDDRKSDLSVQTGKAFVTFEKGVNVTEKDKAEDKEDAKSTRSSATSRISRPPTLQRRLSDLSLGTSFGVSHILHAGQSRSSSSRRVKLSDDDEDSAGSRSENDDEELRSRIKAEQDRLRNMKVGEEFFGGSLSSILDRFDKTDWEEGLSSAVGQLGLDVGTKGTKRDSVTAQDVLALNAQERINEVRRMRTDGGTPSKRRQELSETRTVESGIAPSFAALWLLNQAEDPSAGKKGAQPTIAAGDEEPVEVLSPATITKHLSSSSSQHARQLSNASTEEASTVAHAPSTSRLRSLFSGQNTNTVSASDKRHGVLDRPRQRGPKPKEMGGVSIAQGKLTAEAKNEHPEDMRSTLAGIWTSQTLSQMKEAKGSGSVTSTSPPLPAASDSEAATSPPSSPVLKVPASKDKPAPLKSAIKGGGALKQSLSLADTLFAFPSDKSSKGKLKSREPRDNIQDGKAKGKEKQRGEDEGVNEAKVDDNRRKIASQTWQSTDSPKQSLESVARQSVSATSDQQNETAVTETIARPRVPSDEGVQSLESFPVHTPQPVRPSEANLHGGDSDGDVDASMLNDAVHAGVAQWRDQAHSDDVHDVDSARSPPPVSELWSGESTVSTGPVTPGASDFLDKNIGILPRRGFSPAHLGEPVMAPSPRDKKLPLPPVPSFDADVNVVYPENDQTPLAVSQSEPAYPEQNKTPRAERDEPAFGVNLIPPTPPAMEGSYPANGSLVRTPPTLKEEAENPLDASAVEGHSSLQRSASSRSKGTVKSQNSGAGLTRKSSTKRRSNPAPAGLGEYQGHGLSLPPGLVATTVASSASRKQSQGSEQEFEVSPDPTVKSRKGKGKKTNRSKLDAQFSTMMQPVPTAQPSVVPATTPAPSMQPSLSDGLASLSPPAPGHSDGTSSSRGSDSLGFSRSTSPSPSPAVSVSGRSSAVSSSANSEASSSRGALKHTAHTPRKIRTVSSGPNGHAHTSLMSAISEWESSPVGHDRSGNHSPVPASGYTSPSFPSPDVASGSGYVSPVYQAPSSLTRSQSSVQSGPSPSLVRNAPIGAPTDALLGPAHGAPALAGVNRRLSVPVSESADGHRVRTWGSSYYGDESDISLGMQSQHSVVSLPNVPQSSYRARDPVKASNNIDDRLYAKTTMATVAVTSGAFRNKTVRGRRSSTDLGDQSSRRASLDAGRDGTLVEELQKTTMSLTSHTPPPRKLSSTQVLVQVIACAIDDMDRLLLREKVRNENAFGFVPGRSFCGRVMETGWEVKRMRIGDIVFGLQNSRKCGALAEFMTIEQDLVAKAPEDCLTMEQIAALPSVGVLAHQLMMNHCSQLQRGSRILILNAHDGVGLLTMQECATLGLIIVAHCPNHVSDGVAICEANGAHEVIIGEPLWALNSLHESSFDLVVDTVGGRRVYDAARRILAFEGQFCTCFGDLQSATANPNLRSHLRSLRRTFFKKDTKHLGYEWVGTDTAEDCRQALEAVRKAAEDGLICPRLKSVLAFGEAPRAFENTLRGAEEEPGAVVVRIS